MKRIGIIGGGQLGKMMILDGKRLDLYFAILDPTEQCPAHSIADHHIVARFDDVAAVKQLAKMVDVVTYEFEHISLKALRELEGEGHAVYPSSSTLALIQNKFDQKQWLREKGLPIPGFMKIESCKDLTKAEEQFSYPMILKTCTGGYDGKGNAVIRSREDQKKAYELLGAGSLPLMVEEWVDFAMEISVLACRSLNGDVSLFPVAENHHIDSILDETIVPARIEEFTKKEAMETAIECLHGFRAFGMLCIELFVTKDGHILVNELAPRPHNSGHYTIEGCDTSQYEQHLRGILGLPLGSSGLISPTAMKNIIGDQDGAARLTGLDEAYRQPFVKVHLYGKEMVKKGRKMGHITARGSTVEEALEAVRKAHRALKYKEWEEII